MSNKKDHNDKVELIVMVTALLNLMTALVEMLSKK